jgi:hypothetical protein
MPLVVVAIRTPARLLFRVLLKVRVVDGSLCRDPASWVVYEGSLEKVQARIVEVMAEGNRIISPPFGE